MKIGFNPRQKLFHTHAGNLSWHISPRPTATSEAHMNPVATLLLAPILATPKVLARPPTVTGIEIRYATGAGEGAEGTKSLRRDGCYQVDGQGSPGGGRDVHDRQAGCHLPLDVAPVFQKLDGLLGAKVLTPERKATKSGGARRDGAEFGFQADVVLLRSD